MGCVLEVLLYFGAVSAAIHYNGFSRFLAVVVNRALGIQALSYFDDYGTFRAEDVSREALIRPT